MAKLDNVRISLKIDDLSNWNDSNIILNDGEVALIRDSNDVVKVKVGDGVSHVSSLAYLNETEFFTKKLSAHNANFGLKNVVRQYSVAEGHNVSALGAFSHAEGFNTETISTDNFSFVWNGQNLYGYDNRYKSHGPGTFSLNPTDGLSGIYIGEETLAQILNDKIYIDGVQTPSLSINRVSQDEYHELVVNEQIDENSIYIVSSDTLNMYGERIENVGDPLSASDAVNKQYADNISIELDQKINAIEIPTKVSDLENDLNYALSSDVSVEFKSIENTIEDITNDVEKLSIDLSSKIKLNDNVLSTLNIYKVTADEYHELVTSESVDESALYIVSSDILDMYGEKIVNLADPTENSDATNKQYVDIATINLSNTVSSNYISTITFNDTILKVNDIFAYLSNEISSKIKLDNINLSTLNIYKVTADEYHELVTSESVDESALYIVSSDSLDMYGERIENVGDPLSASDAVNKRYVDAITTDLSDEIKSNYVSSVVFNNEILKLTDIDNYLSNAISSKINVDGINVESLSILKIDADSYHELVTSETIDPNTLYIISSETTNVYGQRIENVGDAVEDTDATNKNYVDSTINEVSTNIESEISELSETLTSNIDVVNSTITTLSDTVKSNYVSVITFNSTISELNIVDTNLSNAISSKIKIDNTDLSTLNIYKVTADEYHNLIVNEQINQSALYIVSSDILNMYGEKIINLAAPIENNDATNKEYVDNISVELNQKINDIEIPTKVSELENDSNYALSAVVDSKFVNVNESIADINSKLSYKIISPEYTEEYDETLAQTVHRYEISNRSITTLNISNSSIPVMIIFPEKLSDNFARDFVLKIVISSTEAPQFIFDGVSETLSFISDSDTWSQLAAGTNVMSFTEISDSEFLVHRKEY